MIGHELEEKEYDAHIGNHKQVNPDACQYSHVSSLDNGHLILLFRGISLPQAKYEKSESRTCE